MTNQPGCLGLFWLYTESPTSEARTKWERPEGKEEISFVPTSTQAPQHLHLIQAGVTGESPHLAPVYGACLRRKGEGHGNLVQTLTREL